MLPTFQVRGLRCCSSDAISGDEERWVDVQLDDLQYEQLIQNHPETTLSYVDDDDGEIITVGSSEELVARVQELHPLTPVIFDLFVSPSHPKYESAIKLWGEILQPHSESFSKGKGKGKEKAEALDTNDTGSVTRSGILVDLSDDGSSSMKDSVPRLKEDPAQQPLLSMFESELEKIFQTTTGSFPADPEVSAPRQPSPVPSFHDTPQPYPSEILGQTLRTIAQNIGRVASELRHDLPSHAQPTVEALNTALHSAIGTFTTQLQNVALDAAAAARDAAQATRDMDVSELEATGRRMKELAETVGHIAIQGAGVAKEEVDKALSHVSEARRAAGQAAETRRAESEVSGDMEEVAAKGKERESEKKETGSSNDAEQSKTNEPKTIWELIQEASESSRTERAPINIADAVNIPAGAQEAPAQPNAFPDSSSDDEDDAPEEIPGAYESRNGRDTTGRRRRHFDPLRPQGGHVDGPPRNNTFPHWAPGHHMFHPRHPRHGRHGPHHGGPPPHHPHFGMPGAHPHPHPHPPPPPPPHSPHGPHGPHDPRYAPSPPPPPPPPQDPNSPHRHPHSPPPPPPPPPPAPPSFFPHHPFHQPPSFWGGNGQSSNTSVTSPSNPLEEFMKMRLRGDTTAKPASVTSGRSGNSVAEWNSDQNKQEDENSNASSPPLFPFIRRANTIGSAVRDREPWTAPQSSTSDQAKDQERFALPVAAIPPIPSTQHVMRRFPSLSSFHPSSNGQGAAGLRAQVSVPNFRSQNYRSQRRSLADIGPNPFASPQRQLSSSSEQTSIPEPSKPEVSELRALPGGWPQAVLIPPPPPPAPMDAFTPRGLHRANTIATTREVSGSSSDSSQRNETNPFTERRRRRESRMSREDNIEEAQEANDWGYYSRRSVPGTSSEQLEQQKQKLDQQKNENDAQSEVDKCVAQLLEMGYAEDESDSALERLKVYAQIAEGRVLDAIEMLEEERQAWVQKME